MGTFKNLAIALENVRIYDNGGRTFDRYTAVYMDSPEKMPGLYECLGMSANPFEGFGMHCTASPGRHLGKRIKFEQLPPDCQKAIMQDLIH